MGEFSDLSGGSLDQATKTRFGERFFRRQTNTVAIDDRCAICGGPLSARYAEEMLSIECEACGHGHGEYSFPPGGLHDRTDAEVLEAFDQRVRHLTCLAKDGVCSAIGLGLLDHSAVASSHSDHGISLSETTREPAATA